MNEPLPRYRITENRTRYDGSPDGIREISVVEGDDALLRELEACGVLKSHRIVSRVAWAPAVNGHYIKWESIERTETMPKLPKVSKSAPLTGTRKQTEGKAANHHATCACLCGAIVGPKSTFRQGHDQRMIGELAQTTVEGSIPQVWIDRLGMDEGINEDDIQNRINYVDDKISRNFSEALSRKFNNAATRRWDKVLKNVPDQSTQEVLELSTPAIEEATDSEFETAPGTPVRIKVGRWEYDAVIHGMNQAGKVTAVRYYKGEKEFVKTEGQFKVI